MREHNKALKLALLEDNISDHYLDRATELAKGWKSWTLSSLAFLNVLTQGQYQRPLLEDHARQCRPVTHKFLAVIKGTNIEVIKNLDDNSLKELS